jgi:hypothetical protein
MPKQNFKSLKKLFRDKRAMSVAISTLIITAGVIAMGIAVLYWTYSWGNIANKQYMENTQAGSSAMEERIGFEYIAYNSTSEELTVNMINWGKSNNLSIARVYIWDSSHSSVGSYSETNVLLKDLATAHTPIAGDTLNSGEEGCVIFPVSLNSTSYYTIRVVTDRGRNFDSSFAT